MVLTFENFCQEGGSDCTGERVEMITDDSLTNKVKCCTYTYTHTYIHTYTYAYAYTTYLVIDI